MAKSKELVLDKSGVQMTMRTKDYLADAGGQLGINLAANLVGQMTYFYTDKAWSRSRWFGYSHAHL